MSICITEISKKLKLFFFFIKSHCTGTLVGMWTPESKVYLNTLTILNKYFIFVFKYLNILNNYFILTARIKIYLFWDFPGGAVGGNLPVNAGDMGSIPGPGRSHMLCSN